jgi:hypothetical protein
MLGAHPHKLGQVVTGEMDNTTLRPVGSNGQTQLIEQHARKPPRDTRGDEILAKASTELFIKRRTLTDLLNHDRACPAASEMHHHFRDYLIGCSFQILVSDPAHV